MSFSNSAIDYIPVAVYQLLLSRQKVIFHIPIPKLQSKIVDILCTVRDRAFSRPEILVESLRRKMAV